MRAKRSEVDVEILDEGSTGILGLKTRPARIRVTLKAARVSSPRSEAPTGGESFPVRPEEDQDGTVEVIAGRGVVRNPKGKGRFPILYPGKGLKIFIGGKELKEPAVVSDKDQIILEPIETASRPFQIRISDDKFTAYLSVGKRRAIKVPDQKHSVEARIEVVDTEETVHEAIDPNKVIAALHEAGVVFGIDTDAVRKALLEQTGEFVAVARGRQLVHGTDARIEYVFQSRAEKEWSDDDAYVDYLDKDYIISVTPAKSWPSKPQPYPGKTASPSRVKKYLPNHLTTWN